MGLAYHSPEGIDEALPEEKEAAPAAEPGGIAGKWWRTSYDGGTDRN